LYKVFLALQGEMFERKKYVSGVDYKQYRLIQNDLPLLQKMKIVVCEYENEPIAVSICSAIGDTGIYLLGATGNKGMRLNGSNLLQWRMIKWLKERGCLYYDLGGIDPEANPGVYRFKCGIAGKIGRDEKHIGQYVFHNNIKAHLLNIAINTTRNIQKRLQTIRKRSN
jgi:lipid II:glycine glycyltransferase (peptidoglycan interpeptide bridge formation enzyme)